MAGKNDWEARVKEREAAERAASREIKEAIAAMAAMRREKEEDGKKDIRRDEKEERLGNGSRT